MKLSHHLTLFHLCCTWDKWCFVAKFVEAIHMFQQFYEKTTKTFLILTLILLELPLFQISIERLPIT